MHTHIQRRNQQRNRRHLKITYLVMAPEPARGSSAHWLASDFHSWINSWIDCQTNVYIIWLSTNSSTVESTVGPTVCPTVRSILKPCKCAITLVGKLPVITGKTAWNWRRAVLSANAGLLVHFSTGATLVSASISCRRVSVRYKSVFY